MRLTRRGFFFGMGAGGALIAAWALTPRRFAAPLPDLAPDRERGLLGGESLLGMAGP